MEIILETERLILREFELSDAQAFFELNADWEVMKYTGDKAFKTIEEAEELIRNYNQYQTNGYGRNTVILRSSNEIIGWCGLKKHNGGLVDLGYRFFKKHWNKGYATESSNAILSHAFNNYNIKEVVGRTSDENLGSIRVLEKLGMQYWKKESCEGIKNSLHYRINKEIWEKNTHGE